LKTFCDQCGGTCSFSLLVAMWVFAGWFIWFAFMLRDRARSSNRDKELSFGQILALATWVPFLVDFAYVWLEGPLDVLNGRLIDPHEAVKAPEKARSSKMGQRGGQEDQGQF
jgi:hypothetical protein